MLTSSFILLSLLVAPAFGISVGYSAGDGGGSVSSSASYELDDTTSLQEKTTLSDSELLQVSQASGSGFNRIKQQVTGKGYSAGNAIDGTGSFSASTSAAASESGASLSQSLSGSGDLSAGLYGSAGTSASAQEAGVLNGVLSTTQSLAAGGGVYTRQSTSMDGETGVIGSDSSTAENSLAVSGGFSGEGDLRADLSAVAAGRAAMSGEASLAGVPVLDSGNLEAVASGDLGMAVEGLYERPSGDLGSFAVSAVNRESGAQGGEPLYQIPDYTSTGGRKEAYLLAGWRWNQKNPQIRLYLKNDANLRNEGLNPAAVQRAIAAAANTWDAATNQNLFADTGTVTVTPYVNSDRYDGKNVNSWNYFSNSPNALAYSRTWYSYNKVGGFYSALESDICYNTRYGWATNGNNIDVQSVALHELGHTIGLGDLYGKSQFQSDTRQVMHYYTGVKRTLGNGDKTGAWLLYG